MANARILVVDDDPGARRAMQDLLRDEGYVVEVAANGAAALERVGEDPPDVLLTDLRMPGMDGIALCRALHELEPELPVIVITAASDVASAVSALRAGAEDYLTKPVDLDAMLLSIARAIDRRIVRIEREQLRLRTGDLYQQALSAVRAHQDVLSTVSHDLRNPLSTISLRAQQLAELEEPRQHEREVQVIATSILRSAQQMERLIADLLEEGRLRDGLLRLERETHQLSDLLADAAELSLLARQKGIHLDIRPPEQDRVVACDRGRISQVLGNLVANAIKFSPGGSTVSVFAEREATGVRFTVRDEGPGITAEVLPRIFDRFWQLEGGRNGVGLGLYIVKTIVDAHGGHVSVESAVGAGATFSFVIPDALGSPGPPTRKELALRA